MDVEGDESLFELEGGAAERASEAEVDATEVVPAMELVSELWWELRTERTRDWASDSRLFVMPWEERSHASWSKMARARRRRDRD